MAIDHRAVQSTLPRYLARRSCALDLVQATIQVSLLKSAPRYIDRIFAQIVLPPCFVYKDLWIFPDSLLVSYHTFQIVAENKLALSQWKTTEKIS